MSFNLDVETECEYILTDFNPRKCSASRKSTNEKTKKCKIIQCEKDHIITSQNNVTLCEEHNELFENGQTVDIFVVPNELYYAINRRFRMELHLLTQKYNDIKRKLLQRKEDLSVLNKKYRRRLGELNIKRKEIGESIVELDLEIKLMGPVNANDEHIIKLNDKITELTKEREQITAENEKLMTELATKESLSNACDASIRSMASALRQFADDQPTVGETVAMERSSMPPVIKIVGETKEQEQDRLEAYNQIKTQEAQAHLLQDGLFTLIRIRCDEPIVNIPKSAKHVELITKANSMKIGDITLEIQGVTTVLYNDRTSKSSCEKDDFIKNESENKLNKEKAMNAMRDIFIGSELKRKNKNGESQFTRDLKPLFLQTFQEPYEEHIKSQKINVQEQAEFYTDVTENPLPAEWLDRVGDDGFKPESNVPKVENPQQKWKEAVIDLKKIAALEIQSAKLTVLSGKEFIKGSSIGFIEKQKFEIENKETNQKEYHYENLLDAITIIGIGGSGAGKTVATKALLQNIIRIYGEVYPEFTKNCSIEVSFRQVYENNDKQIIIENMPIDKHTDKFDINASIAKDFTDGKENLSNEPAIFHDICNPCDSLTKKDSLRQIETLRKIRNYDILTEEHRHVRTTLNNENGSSRSIKIIQVVFTSKKNPKTVTLNLIDTAGYEDYTGDDKLTEFYINKIRQARDEDSTFRISVNPEESKQKGLVAGAKDIENKQIETYVKKTIVPRVKKEGDFIRRSLDYIKNTLKTFDTLQKQIKNKKTTEEMKTTLKAGFKQALDETNKDKNNKEIQSIAWLTPYLKQHSTVIVVAAFKTNMNPTEVSSAVETLKLLKELE